jgi:hypothetical protein
MLNSFYLLALIMFTSQNEITNQVQIQPTKFPSIDTKTLANRVINFPQDVKGRKTLIVLVFEDKGEYEQAQAEADRWFDFWAKHLKKQDIDFYEIPMMSGSSKLFSWFINQSMRSDLPVSKHDAVACFYGDKDSYAKELGLINLRHAHVFLLNKKGEVTTTASGVPMNTHAKLFAAK